MIARFDRDGVPADLIELTRRLGDPAAGLVILAEGNTSTIVGPRLVVKRSGARMELAQAGDFVDVDVDALSRLMDDPTATQADLSTALSTDHTDLVGERVTASIETLVHVAAAEVGATWIAHTHPAPVLGLLCAADASTYWGPAYFPDEAVVLGRPLWVDYVEPGLALGRTVRASLRRHTAEYGAPPRVVLMANHGIVALAHSPAEALAITAMTVKAAEVRLAALTTGEPRPLGPEETRSLLGRADEQQRRRMLR